jgi:hypothetical protein
MSPNWGDWNTDTATSTDIEIQGDTFTLASAIPDSVVAQYLAEDTADTTTATDSVGGNTINLSGPTYETTSPLCDTASLSFDGTGGTGISQNTVDLVSTGTSGEVGIGCYINANSADSNGTFLNWGVDGDNLFELRIKKTKGVEATLGVNGSYVFNDLGGDLTKTQHIWANLDQSQIEVFQNNTSLGTISHSLDITNIGAGNYNLAQRSGGGAEWSVGGLLDNITFSNAKLSSSERQQLIDQC